MLNQNDIDSKDVLAQKQALEESSHYAKILLQRFPNYSEWLWTQNQILKKHTVLELHRDLMNEIGNDFKSFFHIACAFRRFKQRHFLRLAMRDLLKLDDVSKTTEQISDLANTCFQTAIHVLRQFPSLWRPYSWDDTESLFSNVAFTIIGFGKLGGRELNFVSDVDIMFLYEISQNTSKDIFRLTSTLLPKFCNSVNRLLGDLIEGDRVFSVDVRLRPGGKDSELAISLPFAIHHYLVEGQSWERFALLKAQPIAGDMGLGRYFLREIQPFVYRRFLDFQAIDEVRGIRDKILKETPSESPGPGYNVKLGKGGIREIEFITQALQIIYGGRSPEIRESNTLKALRRLSEYGVMAEETATSLAESYEILRRTEHWIQLAYNVQTHKIPKTRSSLERLVRAVFRLNPGVDVSKHVEGFIELIKRHTGFVYDQFLALFGEVSATIDMKPHQTQQIRNRDKAGLLKKALMDWGSKKSDLIGERKAFFDCLIGAAENAIKGLPNTLPIEIIAGRITRFADGVLRRPGLVKFFLHFEKSIECETVLDTCLYGIVRSSFIADFLISLPGLAESLAEGKLLVEDCLKWTERCDNLLSSTSLLEEKIQWLRRVKNERIIAIALWDIVTDPGPELIERELTDLAEYFVRRTYDILCEKMGVSSAEYPLCICALGKLGSREMNYRSDLDLMFVYDPECVLKSESPLFIPPETTRFVQRFVRLLSVSLEDGPGYEVDMRLRPSGNYGPLVVTKKTWSEYYEQQADPWEYASLVRFRPLAGHNELAQFLTERASQVLSVPRDNDKTWARLCELRNRMEQERVGDLHGGDGVNIKLGSGGIVDVELWCQGTVVVCNQPRWVPGCSTWEMLEDVLSFWGIPSGETTKIRNAFRTLRQLEQRIILVDPDGPPGWVRSYELGLLRDFGLIPRSCGLDEARLEEVKRIMVRIRRWWNWVCEYRKPMRELQTGK